MARKTERIEYTTPELIEQFNKKNKKLMERFLRNKDTVSSSGTVRGYESDLNIFFVWNMNENDDKFFIDIKKLELSDFFSFGVNELKWSSSRYARVRAALSSFSNFIEKYYDEDYPDFRNIVLKAVESMPKVPARKKTILKDEQIDELLDLLVKEERYQEACFLALGVSCGARLSELFRIGIDIIDFDNLAYEDIFIETTEKIKTKGKTKAGTLLHKYIIKDLFEPYYNLWIPKREEILKDLGIETNDLFIKSNGSPATDAVVRGWFKKWETVIGVDFYAHAMRHYTVTYLSKRGLETELIQDIMGWSSIDMVGIYDDNTSKDKKWKGLSKLKNELSKLE